MPDRSKRKRRRRAPRTGFSDAQAEQLIALFTRIADRLDRFVPDAPPVREAGPGRVDDDAGGAASASAAGEVA